MSGVNMNMNVGMNRTLGTKLDVSTQRTRQTEHTDFGSKLKEGLSKAADIALQAGNVAAPFIPGGSVVSAAISGVSSLKDAAAGSSSGLSGIGGAVSSNSSVIGGASAGGSVSTGAGVSGAVGGSGDSSMALLEATKQMQEMSQQFNLQYLQLQQDMQNENRQFSMVSNIMKVKHDTAKTAIQNVR